MKYEIFESEHDWFLFSISNFENDTRLDAFPTKLKFKDNTVKLFDGDEMIARFQYLSEAEYKDIKRQYAEKILIKEVQK